MMLIQRARPPRVLAFLLPGVSGWQRSGTYLARPFAMKVLLFVSLFALPLFSYAQQSTADIEESKPAPPAAEGATAPPKPHDDRFTHGESKRCESLSGDAKLQCDKEEATKSEGENARELTSEEPAQPQRQ